MPYKDWSKQRVYLREYMKLRWRKRRAEAIKKLGGKCKACGLKKKLQFDHKNFRDKLFSLAKWPSIREDIFWKEVAKCQLLCFNCHVLKSKPELSLIGKEREARKRVSSVDG